MTDNFDARPAIAQALAAIRRERNMTRRQVANELGRTVATISRWENGRRTPEVNDLYALADVYGTTPSVFLPSKDLITQAREALNKEE